MPCLPRARSERLPVWQLPILHSPPTQEAAALRKEHALPQPPQFCVCACVSTHVLPQRVRPAQGRDGVRGAPVSETLPGMHRRHGSLVAWRALLEWHDVRNGWTQQCQAALPSGPAQPMQPGDLPGPVLARSPSPAVRTGGARAHAVGASAGARASVVTCPTVIDVACRLGLTTGDLGVAVGIPCASGQAAQI